MRTLVAYLHLRARPAPTGCARLLIYDLATTIIAPVRAQPTLGRRFLSPTRADAPTAHKERGIQAEGVALPFHSHHPPTLQPTLTLQPQPLAFPPSMQSVLAPLIGPKVCVPPSLAGHTAVVTGGALG